MTKETKSDKKRLPETNMNKGRVKKNKKKLIEFSIKGLTHPPPLNRKKIKRHVVFWAF